MAPTRIIIIGGGFSGVRCAKTLRRKLSSENHDVTLFNQENHMVFQPLLAEVVGSSLNDEDVAAPLRQLLPGVRCRTEQVLAIDLEKSLIDYEGEDGCVRQLPYDHLVIACGSRVNLGMVPGMADHAMPLKTVGDAVALRAHIIEQLEKAEVCENADRRKWYLSFIVVGGGYSGVEVAGEINDFVRGSTRFFANIPKEDVRVTVIHSRDQILPEIGPSLRAFAQAKMEKAGIQFILNSRVALATNEGVGTKDGQFVRGASIVCTIGNTISPIIERLKVEKKGDRLVTQADMRLAGAPNVWAIGDCAHNLNAYDNQPAPPTGQFAEREGLQAAENIMRVLRNEPTRPFSHKPLGQLCSIGGHNAVAEIFGLRMSGFVAWFLWRSVYLFKVPSWSRRMKVGLDWAWDLLFARDLSHIRPNTTERVSGAYYQPGDYVFRQGDPALNFYVIEAGEAEVIRCNTITGKDEVVAVLGPGSFFGEMALVGNKERNAGVRARTPLEVTVMGRNVFTQVSQSLGPLRDLIARTVERRGHEVWQRLPAAREVLSQTPLEEFMEPPPQPLLRPDQGFEDALSALDHTGCQFCYVVEDGYRLVGVVTRTDLLNALEAGIGKDAKIRGFMCANPIAVTRGDNSLVAAATMREHQIKWIPVVSDHQNRRLEGYVRAQSMVGRVLRALPEKLDASAYAASDSPASEG